MFKPEEYLIIYLSIRFYDSCRRLPENKRHSSLFLHWSCSKFLAVMAACTSSIHVFLGRPLFRLSSGTHSKINFGIHSSGKENIVWLLCVIRAVKDILTLFLPTRVTGS
jgi:hypothetical protein